MASTAEVHEAVLNAKAAQPAWAAKNPQVRARVMMKFLELANQHREELALARLGTERRGRPIWIGHAEEVEYEWEPLDETLVEGHALVAYLVKHFGPDNDRFQPVVTKPLGR